jgi:hypothetical protein
MYATKLQHYNKSCKQILPKFLITHIIISSDHREVLRKETNSGEVTGITERSPKISEVPLKARLRSSCKKNDPLPAITSKLVTETVPAEPEDNILPVISTAPALPVQEEQLETMEIDSPEKPVEQAGMVEQIQQEENGNIQSQNAEECFIVDDGVRFLFNIIILSLIFVYFRTTCSSFLLQMYYNLGWENNNPKYFVLIHFNFEKVFG